MKNLKFLLLFLLFTLKQAVPNYAQTQKSNNEVLTVGDTISKDISLKIFNKNVNNTTIGDYRGKWLILDFWESYCMPCINAMPKFKKLNDYFSGKLEIVLTTKADAIKIVDFLSKSTIAKGTDFSFIIEDTILNRLFPHKVIPHEVWIDPNGVIRAITTEGEVNKENIDKILLEPNAKIRMKSEDMSWNKEKMVGAGTEDNLLFRSILKSYDPSFPSSGWFKRGSSSSYLDSANFYKIKHVYFSNYRPIQLFYDIYMFLRTQNSGNMNPNRIIVEVRDSLKRMQYANANLRIPFGPKMPYMHYKDMEEYNNENLFSYDLTLPDYLPQDMVFNFVFDDLNHYFPIKAKIEKRLTSSLVLNVNNNLKTKRLLFSKGGEPLRKVDDESINIKNHPKKVLFNYLNKMLSKPIVDETGIDYNIDINVSFKDSKYLDKKMGLVLNMLTFDDKIFIKEMSKYGIEVKEQQRWVDLLIIYD